MNQWDKYDVEMLLDIADSTNAPDENERWRARSIEFYAKAFEEKA